MPVHALASSDDAFAITPSDSTNFTTGCRAVYVGGAGTVNAVMKSGPVSFAAVAGCVLPIAPSRINVTGTSATGLVGLL